MAQKVLYLPELLEQILVQLPPRDLLFSQKVCRIWKVVVDTSPTVQVALFFTASRDSSVTNADTGTNGVFGHCCTCAGCIHSNSKMILNPLLFTLVSKWGRHIGLRDLMHNASPALDKQASCRRMMLSQPAKIVDISFYTSHGGIVHGPLRTGIKKLDVEGNVRILDPTGGLSEVWQEGVGTFETGLTLGETVRMYQKATEGLKAEGHEQEKRGWWIDHARTMQ
ncbi:hypothetical protein LTR27_000860 [Elasticomyces elasticus]|nr:hypothetical protein LTR27_000860 [Elasticomyces elasticus]